MTPRKTSATPSATPAASRTVLGAVWKAASEWPCGKPDDCTLADCRRQRRYFQKIIAAVRKYDSAKRKRKNPA